jgi:hypothetical protein
MIPGGAALYECPPANQPLHLTAAASRFFEVQRLTIRCGR